MSMVYLNVDTGEYPRFAGDVAVNPHAHWEIVEDTPAPTLNERDVLIEGMPIQDERGVYRRTWSVETLTEEQWQAQQRVNEMKFFPPLVKDNDGV